MNLGNTLWFSSVSIPISSLHQLTYLCFTYLCAVWILCYYWCGRKRLGVYSPADPCFKKESTFAFFGGYHEVNWIHDYCVSHCVHTQGGRCLHVHTQTHIKTIRIWLYSTIHTHIKPLGYAFVHERSYLTLVYFVMCWQCVKYTNVSYIRTDIL